MANLDRSFHIIGEFISTQSRHYWGTAATFLISSYLAFNNPGGWARTISVSSAIFSVGYGVSTAASSRRYTHFADLLRDEFDSRLLEAENAQQAAINSLIEEHQAAQNDAQERITELEANHVALEANYHTAKAELKEAIDKLTAARHKCDALQAQVKVHIDQFTEMRANFDREEAELKKSLNERERKIVNKQRDILKAKFKQLRQELEAQFEKRLAELDAETTRRIKVFKSAYITRQKHWVDQYRSIEEQYDQLNEQWQQHLNEHIARYEELIADYKKVGRC